MDFDHKRAWKEVASPAFESLHGGIHSLITQVSAEAENIRQNYSLDCIGLSPGLKLAFDQLARANPRSLAEASQVVYFFGHWGGKADLQYQGVYWKFSHLADQAIRDRLEIPRRVDNKSGCYTTIGLYDGVLHAQINTPWSYFNREITLATPENLAVIQATSLTMPTDVTYRRHVEKWADKQLEIAKALRTILAPAAGPAAGFFNLARYGGGNAD